MIRRLVLSLLLALLVTPSLHASFRYDPRLRFRTLTTPRFDIHFHQGGDQLARRLAAIAESVAADLEPRLGRPRARVHVILVDQTDLANGWATPLPYNLIELVVASPRGESSIGNTSDWLRLVFVHEYTHILHLERSRGFFGAVGRAFGRNPFFYPNLLLPTWQIEGLATYHESAGTREGRIHAGDFRMLLERDAGAGRFLGLDRTSSSIVQWPGGQTPYLYGAFFHQYLADTYGEASLTRLADATAGRLPFFGSPSFKKVFGKSLGALWDDFERAATNRAPATGTEPTRLTTHGFTVEDPWFSRTGTLYYSIANAHGFPSLMEWRPSGSVQVATRVGGEQISVSADNRVLFDQVEYVRSVALQSDLYAYDAAAGRVYRLTREQRAADPDVSPDGKTVVCIVQTPEGRAVATMPLTRSSNEGQPKLIAVDGGADFASPRWSPDGRAVAVERRLAGGPSQIVLLDPRAGTVERIVTTSVRGRNTTPAWSPDGRTIFFSSDRDGGPFQIYAANLAAGTLRRLESAGRSAQSPALSPDGARIVFVGYTPSGYDLFAMALGDARWQDVANDTPLATPRFQDPSRTQAVEARGAYSPFRTLLPRFWTPIIEEDGERTSVGAATAGMDALGRHSYYGAASWSTRGRPDWSTGYAYDRWRPTFFADVSDDQEPWRSGDIRVRELNVGALMAFRRVRRTQTVTGTFHAANERIDCASCDPAVVGDADRRALRAGYVFDSSRGFGYSISREEGVSAALSAEWTASGLGADGDAGALVADLRGYRATRPGHAVIAARVAGARAWGDEAVRRVFAVGDTSASVPVLDFGLGAISLLRGFEAADLNGRHAVVANLDYRVPLAWIERGAGTWPFFVRSLHGALFSDFGSAWDDTRGGNDWRASFGAELSADVVVGFSLPLTVSGGVAFRHDPTHQSGGPTMFARIGRAF